MVTNYYEILEILENYTLSLHIIQCLLYVSNMRAGYSRISAGKTSVIQNELTYRQLNCSLHMQCY